MNGKNLLEGRTGPVTQSVEAVKNLLAFVGRASDPMPSDVTLDNGRLVLVLNNKRDAYYTCTARACSCPSATYRHNGPCKHQRKYFPGSQKSAVELEAESDAILAAHNAGAKRLARPPEDSIRPTGKWTGGLNGPVDRLPGEKVVA